MVGKRRLGVALASSSDVRDAREKANLVAANVDIEIKP